MRTDINEPRSIHATAMRIMRAVVAVGLLSCSLGLAQTPTFESARTDLGARLETSLVELATLREAIVAERIPLGEELSALELELSAARAELQDVTRQIDGRSLDLSNLRTELKQRKDESSYVANQLGEYIRNFESRLHIGEKQRYRESIDAARTAPEKPDLDQREVFAVQASLLTRSFERLEDALGGTRFAGNAVDPNGLVQRGQFLLVGPYALFRADSGHLVGTAEQRLSTEPIVAPFGTPEDNASAGQLVVEGAGTLPFDPTLGNAHKMEATQEGFVEHIKNGGPVMIPILLMAAAALLVALAKWIRFTFVRRPGRKTVQQLFEAVARNDREATQKLGSAVSDRGPLGGMLWTGVQHLDEPRALVEEAMYENVLTAKLRLNSFLPFIAICAASAPLLGLLGTVTGIINTFKLITVFGSGDVKSLSGGISEALITTKFGLIVAIPSLLMHAFLSRKARGIVADMEATAVGFVNRIPDDGARQVRGVSVAATEGSAVPDEALIREQVTKILGEMLGPLDINGRPRAKSQPSTVR